MHSCSNEFLGKFSNPKMSNRPTAKCSSHDALLNVSRQLIWLTIQSNSRPYSPLAMASRAAQASATVLFLVIVSPRVTTLFNVSASNISLGSTPRRRETLCKGARSVTRLLLSVLSCVTTSPNSRSPRCKIAARIQYTVSTSSS